MQASTIKMRWDIVIVVMALSAIPISVSLSLVNLEEDSYD